MNDEGTDKVVFQAREGGKGTSSRVFFCPLRLFFFSLLSFGLDPAVTSPDAHLLPAAHPSARPTEGVGNRRYRASLQWRWEMGP